MYFSNGGVPKYASYEDYYYFERTFILGLLTPSSSRFFALFPAFPPISFIYFLVLMILYDINVDLKAIVGVVRQGERRDRGAQLSQKVRRLHSREPPHR